MKILTWNCNGALRNKFEHLSSFKADIHVIQECENPVEIKHDKYRKWAENHCWIGDSKNRGIGIFADKSIKLDKLNWSDCYEGQKVKHFLPCRINRDFNLLAVWTHKNNAPTFGYIGQLWKYIQVNKANFKNSLILGDFNSNVFWDKRSRWWNHSDVVRELKKIGIESLYHKYWSEEQGKETRPTLFLQRNLLKPYHIDYVFGSKEFQNALKKMEVGDVNKWLKFSDHLPITCEFAPDLTLANTLNENIAPK
ncbi:endonuclease/exonuclease/phosphatase family protein [Pricia sp. S334]|uniref:Endonuclease/exonuclease/phosphatase family protein n=1 Tax=Pricia mediterranea TaxID=3076079 RepID=A0ABU3KZX5_9FLAO|nr:endonuclease/exonuclease/phosphatase family protein [Pricia sp. S334]MDT7827045.1 endonuclease/exonuclease/phosphatase family protein [Pricia sp. S334]MDT7830733.1 endonuclease/exonuclease/phosphatase family protein [Pricia sp. S334]